MPYEEQFNAVLHWTAKYFNAEGADEFVIS